MLKITETEPYYILPTQRYDLTTRPPSKSMQGDYTLFISFKVDDLIKTSTPCGIMMRPGMHYGLCYTQEANSINYEFWYEEDGENKFHMLHMLIERVRVEGGTIRVLAPEDLGDDYNEIVENLNLIGKAGVPLIIGD